MAAKSGMQKAAKGGNESKSTAAQSADALLKADHRKVESIFSQYENASGSEEKMKLAMQVCKELIVHTLIEEQLFYPACREKGVEHDMLDVAQVEHDGAKTLIAELIEGSPDDEFYDAKVSVLSEYIKHHVGEEEKPRTGIIAKAQSAGVDMNALGQKLQARKQQLMAAIDENRLEPPQPRSLHVQPENKEYDSMPRNSNYRERDERGRFTDDDDDRRSYRSRGRDDDDDRGRSHGGWFGDSEGHSQAARSRGPYSRSRYDDDDHDRGSRGGSGRGQGGWFGDPEGHSEASERGWEHSSHEGSGWYGDPRGHSQASRRGWERSDHEGSGWYGDPQGHSEASREGWDDRGRSRNMSSRSSRSRYEDDDDDRRSRGGRGRSHGGWFGDPEGHSEASRRGWDDR